jgi:hypothetical protein
VGIAAALAAGPAAGQDVRYTGSVGYASGSYVFTERTESFSLLNGLSVTAGRWSLSASLPVVVQNSGAVSFVGGMGVPTGAHGDSGGSVRHGGGGGASSYDMVVGDPLVRGSVDMYRGSGAVRSVGLQAMLKAPVADVSTGVGTGAWDLGGGVSAGLAAGRTYLFVDASVWSPGDLPDLELRPYVAGAAGIGRPLSARWSVLASASVASSAIEGLDPPASLSGGISYRPDGGASVNAGVGVGLTQAAPDFTLYVGWGTPL